MRCYKPSADRFKRHNNPAPQWNKISEMARQGIGEGAHLATVGRKPEQLEQTGGDNFERGGLRPVVGVTPFDTEEEAITLANDNPYGLAGAVWTQNVARGHRVASQVRAGTFWINGDHQRDVALRRFRQEWLWPLKRQGRASSLYAD